MPETSDINSKSFEQMAAEADNGRKMLVFSLGGKAFALPAEYVNEVIHPPALTHLPAAPEAVLGITVIGGDVRPVIDLAKLLQITQPVNYSRSKMIIINDTKRDFAVCVPVDKVREIASFCLPGESISDDDSLVSYAVDHGSENTAVIDHLKILEAIRPSSN